MKGEFYKMDYESWDEDCEDLTMEQVGCYLTLCHQMYRRRGPVKDNLKVISHLWRCHPNKAKVILAHLIKTGKLVREDGNIFEKNVLKKLEIREEIRATKADAGRLGGSKRGENIRLLPGYVEGFERRSVSSKTRSSILERDGYECQYCGCSEGKIEVDHLHPVSRGGSNHPSNLLAACKNCNLSQGAKLLTEWKP